MRGDVKCSRSLSAPFFRCPPALFSLQDLSHFLPLLITGSFNPVAMISPSGFPPSLAPDGSEYAFSDRSCRIILRDLLTPVAFGPDSRPLVYLSWSIYILWFPEYAFQFNFFGALPPTILARAAGIPTCYYFLRVFHFTTSHGPFHTCYRLFLPTTFYAPPSHKHISTS